MFEMLLAQFGVTPEKAADFVKLVENAGPLLDDAISKLRTFDARMAAIQSGIDELNARLAALESGGNNVKH